MFSMAITPKFGDTDALGHINNISLPGWFEAARNPIFRLFVPDLDFAKWNLIMVHIDVDFKGQLYYGEDVTIRSYVSKIGNSSFTVFHEAWQRDSLCASGSAVIVYFDFSTQKPQPIPEAIRVELAKHLQP